MRLVLLFVVTTFVRSQSLPDAFEFELSGDDYDDVVPSTNSTSTTPTSTTSYWTIEMTTKEMTYFEYSQAGKNSLS